MLQFLKRNKKLVVIVVLLVSVTVFMSYIQTGKINWTYASQDTTTWPTSFQFGRVATPQEITKLAIAIPPSGRGLPNDNGNSVLGKTIYISKCAVCHGKGDESLTAKLPAAALVNKEAVSLPYTKFRTIGNYWPYATTIFDYMRRAMPLNAPGSLTNKEVYSLTAYLLSANKVIDSTATVNQYSLPKIVMPAQKLFIADDRKGGPEVK